jgi:hypothetical protein
MGGRIQCSSSLNHGTKFWYAVSLCIYPTDVAAFLDLDKRAESPCVPSGTVLQPGLDYLC